MGRLFQRGIQSFFIISLFFYSNAYAGWDDLIKALRHIKVSTQELKSIEKLIIGFNHSAYNEIFDLTGVLKRPLSSADARRVFRSPGESVLPSPNDVRPIFDRSLDDLEEILSQMAIHTDLDRSTLMRVRSLAIGLSKTYDDELSRVFRYIRAEEASLLLRNSDEIKRARVVLDTAKAERFFNPEELSFFRREFQIRWNDIEDWIEINRHRIKTKNTLNPVKPKRKPRHDLIRQFDFKDLDAARKEQKLLLMMIRRIDEGIPIGKVSYSDQVLKVFSGKKLKASLGILTPDEVFSLRRPWFLNSADTRFAAWLRPYLFDDLVQTITDFRRGLVWTIKYKYRVSGSILGTVGIFVLALTAAQPLAQLYIGSQVKRMAMTVAQEQYSYYINQLEKGPQEHNLEKCPFCDIGGEVTQDDGHEIRKDWESLTNFWLSLYTNSASEVTDEMSFGRHSMVGIIKEILLIRNALVVNKILDHVIKIRLNWEPSPPEKRKMLGDLNEIFTANEWLLEWAYLYPLIYPRSAAFMDASLYHLGFQHFVHSNKDFAKEQYDEIRDFLIKQTKEELEIVEKARNVGLKVEEVGPIQIFEEVGVDPTNKLKFEENGIKIDFSKPQYATYRINFEDYSNAEEFWDKVRGNKEVIEVLERIEDLEKSYDAFFINISSQALESLREQRELIEEKVDIDEPGVVREFSEKLNFGQDYWKNLSEELDKYFGNKEELKRIIGLHNKNIDEISQQLVSKIDHLIEMNRRDQASFLSLRMDYDCRLLDIMKGITSVEDATGRIDQTILNILEELQSSSIDREVIKKQLSEILFSLENRLPDQILSKIDEAKRTLHDDNLDIKAMLSELQNKIDEIKKQLEKFE